MTTWFSRQFLAEIRRNVSAGQRVCCSVCRSRQAKSWIATPPAYAVPRAQLSTQPGGALTPSLRITGHRHISSYSSSSSSGHQSFPNAAHTARPGPSMPRWRSPTAPRPAASLAPRPRPRRPYAPRRDLLRRHASLESQGPGGHRLRPGGAGQRPGQPQPDQGDLLPAPADVQPDAERPGQQRLQRRDVQDHRPAPGRTTSAHAQQRHLPRPGEHLKRPTGLTCVPVPLLQPSPPARRSVRRPPRVEPEAARQEVRANLAGYAPRAGQRSASSPLPSSGRVW